RQVVLVAPSEAVLEQAAEPLGTLPSVTGDPGTDAVLTGAGVQRATGVVISMESDKDTALAVLTARRLAPGARIIASTEHPENEDKLRTAGADAVVSPSRTGGLRMASELVRPKVVSFLDQMLRDERSSLRVEELTIAPGAAGVGRPLATLQVDQIAGALLLAVRDPGSGVFAFKPAPDTVVVPGMTLVIMADTEGRARLERRLLE
ncbi:MAG: potassium channel family protein, partial [Gemmatimonadales bacterium]